MDKVSVTKTLAFHADILLRVRHGGRKKNVDQSQQTSKFGKCTLDLEKFGA